MNLQKKYEEEKGLSCWEIKDYTYTKDYVEWVKEFVNSSEHTSAKLVRKFVKEIKREQVAEH